MNAEKKPRYKDIHGTTRVGDWLREYFPHILSALGGIVPGGKPILDVLKNVLGNHKELTPEEREHALKLIEMDLEELREVSKRWDSDMKSDNSFSKNIRPATLAFLSFFTGVLIVCDSAFEGFVVDEAYVALLEKLLMIVFLAYFGGRTYEKIKGVI